MNNPIGGQSKPAPELDYGQAIRHAVRSIIDADLGLEETRTAIMSLIESEFHLTHYQPGEPSA